MALSDAAPLARAMPLLRAVFISLACGFGLALAPACGLAPHDSGARAVPSDGVSGFGDATLIELCVGTARVVPPSASASAAGLCVREETSGAACADDASCAGDGIERCICGRCVVEACEGAAACGGGRVCRGRRCTASCADDGGCRPGERCISGGCARSCSSDAACSFGERCDPLDGACASKLCGGALACGPGSRCELEQVSGEVHEPALALLSSGERIAFVEVRSGGASLASGVYRARIDAASRWTADPPEPVLAPVNSELRVGAPSARVREGSLELYIEVNEASSGAFIARASSLDGGLSFTRDPGPLLAPLEPWEAGRVGSPSVIDHGGQIYLFYEGGLRAGIGLARIEGADSAPAPSPSPSPAVATRLSSSPVASPSSVEDPVLWRSVIEIGSPHAVVADGAVRLYVTARGVEGGDAMSGDTALPADSNDSIGLLTSRDLAAFSPYPAGPVFARVANLRAYLGEREPFVTLFPAGAEIFFIASDGSGKAVGTLARAASR